MKKHYLLSFLFLLTISRLIAQDITYTTLYDNTILNRDITVNTTVGSTPGTGAVSATGAATYSIPISVPPGTNGVVPSLSIEYNSMSGNNLLGMGWNISGLGSISRVARNMYFDNAAGPVELSTNDRFAMDGQRLISKSGIYGAPNSTYGTENENFATVISRDTSGVTGPAYFVVITKDGVQMEFGKTSDSRFMDVSGNSVLFWRLSRVRNPDGNYIEYVYTSADRDPRISEIRYTGNDITGLATYNKIEFTYKIRQNTAAGFSDIKTIYEAGSSIVSKYLLDLITVKAEGALFKKYQFNYGHDNINSYLKNIQEIGSDGISYLNATVFKYGDAPQPLLNESGPLLPAGLVDFLSSDFDGNGKSDMLLAYYTTYHPFGTPIGYSEKKYTGFNIYRDGNSSNATGLITFGAGTQIKTNLFRANDYSFLRSDFNGDGLDDILTTTIRTAVIGGVDREVLDAISIYQSKLSPAGLISNQLQFSGIGVPTSAPYQSCIPENRNYIFNGDFDGDGIQDFFTLLQNDISVGGQYHADFYKMYSSGPNPYNIYNIVKDTDNTSLGNTWVAAKKILILDFNGDGKDDVMTIEGTLTRIYSFAGTLSDGKSAFKLIYSSSTFLKASDTDVLFGDFNGDGKTDILYKEYADGNQNNLPWFKAISTGLTFEKSSFTFASLVGVFSDNEILHVADFNGDGKSDVYHQYKNPASSPSKADVYYSKGTEFYTQQFTFSVDANYGRPSVPFDLNGDGRAEIVYRQNSTLNLGIISLKKSGKENLLEKVENGVGHVTTWGYNNLSDGGSFYNKGAVTLTDYPFHNIQLPMYAVSNFDNQDGVSGQYSQHSYEQAKLHRAGKGFIGFGKTTVFDLATGYKTVSENEFNTTFYIAIPKKSSTKYNANDALVSQTTLTNELVSPAAKRYWVKTAGVQNISFGGGTATTSYVFDAFGNITQSTVNNNGIELIVTDTQYKARPGDIPNKPTSVTVSSKRSDPTPYTVTTKFGHNKIGQIITQTDFDGRTDSIGTVHEYFPLGNLKKTIITPKGTNAPPARSNSAVYDNKGRYPITSTNLLNQTSSTTYHPKWGTPLTATGIDGLVTYFSYNVFGRLSKTTLPEGYSISDTLRWDISGNSIWYNHTTHSGKPDVKTWYDKVGHEVKFQTEAFDGTWITKTNTYNLKGNLTSSTEPYKTGEDIVTLTNVYDEYNRPIQISSSISATAGTVNLSYNYTAPGILTTTKTRLGTTVAGNQVSSIITDAAGKTTSITDHGGTLNYSYYNHGGLKDVKNSTATLITNEYDAYGRQTKLIDQNAGTTQYVYNILGELVRQTNANGDVHTMIYDLMGRNTNRSGPEGNTGYEFYPSSSGASTNQLKKVTGFAGNIIEYTYDGFGRVGTITETVDTTPHLTTYGYNVYGDVISTLYPSGFKTNYAYNAKGYLTTIKNTDNTITLFNNAAMNGRGQITNYSLGNGKSSVNSYTYGFPTKFETNNSANQNIQNLTLNWNYGLACLNSRSDVMIRNGITTTKTESFTHDNLDRLKTSTIGSATFTTNYAGNGNISDKTDAGIYTYHATKQNAVIAVTNPVPSPIPLLQQDITYTSFMQPEKVTENTTDNLPQELVYTYGADYERIKSITKLSGNVINTRYYFGGFEKDITGASTKYLHYINSPAGLIAIVVRENGADTYNYTYTDHLGSILTVTNNIGAIIAEQNFDAWGRRRNPATWELLPPTATTSLPTWLYRGYTGHEHLDRFGLINMNGRMYDPVLARMLSPDNLVPDAMSTQGYNRYSYAFNNPLTYNDPDGQNPLLFLAQIAIKGAIANGVGYIIGTMRNGDDNKFTLGGLGQSVFSGAMSAVMSFGIGNSAGYIGGVNGAIFQTAAHAVMQGAVESTQGGSFQSGMSAGLFGSISASGDGSIGSAAFVGGLSAKANGGNFWHGAAQAGSVAAFNHYSHQLIAEVAARRLALQNKVGGQWDGWGKGSVNYSGKAWFGSNFIGPGSDKNPYTLGLVPIDLIDAAAQQHDYQYYKLGSSGIKGAVYDKAVMGADLALAERASSIMRGYKTKIVDLYTNQPISVRTYNIAKAVYYSFNIISMSKFVRIISSISR